MKEIIKKPYFLRSIVLSLLVVIFFLNLAVLGLSLTGVAASYSLWTIADVSSSSYFADTKTFALALKVAYFVTLAPLGFAVFDLIKKKNRGFYVAVFYLFAFALSGIAFQGVYHYLSLGAIVILSFDIVFLILAFALLVLARNFAKENVSASTEVAPNEKKLHLLAFILDIVSITGLLFSILYSPLYAVSADKTVCVIANVLSADKMVITDFVFFLLNLVLLIAVGLLFISTISDFLSDKKRFFKRSGSLMGLELAVALQFFLSGFAMQFTYALNGKKATTMAYIPLIIVVICVVLFAILKGRYEMSHTPERKDVPEKKALKVEPLLYVGLVTLVTLISLFFNIIDVNFKSGSYTKVVKLTGIKLLSDYSSFSSGYQALAFGLVVMILCSGIGLILSLIAYFSHSKRFPAIAQGTVYLNILFIFLFGISGLYFSIATQITSESTQEVIAHYDPTYQSSYSYVIKTDVIYTLIADLVILAVMIIRRVLEAKEVAVADLGNSALPAPTPEAPKEEKKPEEKPLEEEVSAFDPCPAFSELDAKAESYKEDLAAREKLKANKGNLNDLVHFVVDYAKDSRLHLSYSAETIATFVAGLGACRLSILQGMSGTGKTSLPKIFMEAIDGDCDIVEVESSWKDKNELLGYYNEFSNKYTPKKFTQALYKAALNKEIPTFIVLDEMNLSRIEYYFSDFLSLMENEEDKREIKLLNIELARQEKDGLHPYLALEEGHTLKVPANIWFIGTANRDESTFVISDKVYDRAHTMNFTKRAPKVRDYSAPIPQRFYSYSVLSSLLSEAKNKHTFDAENNDLIKKTEELLSPYNISFGNRILKQIEDFVCIYEECFPDRDVQDEAVETILLSKVVSKLEVKTLENKEDLARDFDNLSLHKCAEFISKLNED